MTSTLDLKSIRERCADGTIAAHAGDVVPMLLDMLEARGKKLDAILNYSSPWMDYKWSSTIVGIILGCDFRDSIATYTALKEKTW